MWSVTHPEVVTGIHKAYLEAGSNYISTNTFGANGKKLAGCGYTVDQVVTAAVQCAKKAAEGTDAKILLDIGPLGEMLQPMGTLPFEQACDLFKEAVAAGAAAGADAGVFRDYDRPAGGEGGYPGRKGNLQSAGDGLHDL